MITPPRLQSKQGCQDHSQVPLATSRTSSPSPYTLLESHRETPTSTDTSRPTVPLRRGRYPTQPVTLAETLSTRRLYALTNTTNRRLPQLFLPYHNQPEQTGAQRPRHLFYLNRSPLRETSHLLCHQETNLLSHPLPAVVYSVRRFYRDACGKRGRRGTNKGIR